MPITTLDLDHLLRSTDHGDFSGRRALSDVSVAIAKARRVVVVSGAGISCSSGIPDFRSEDGLYSMVKSQYPDQFFTGKDLFSSGLFNDPSTTSIFYTFIAALYQSCQKAEPTRTHHFIERLEQKGKLLRSYTQNVDGLERRLGLESGGRGSGLKKRGTRNVELHGDLGRVRCVLCMKDYEAREEYMEMFRTGDAPDCPCCLERSTSRVQRSARATPIGSLRPSIVLYDEPHPLGDDIGDLQTYDLGRNPDLLLIMGTSLKVHGLKRVVKEFAKVVHNRKNGMVVFVNTTPPSKEWEGIIDVHIQGETDIWVERVEEEWKKVRPADWEIQTRLDGEIQVTGGGREVVKPKAERKPKAEKSPSGDVKPKKETEVKPRVVNSGKGKVRAATTKPRVTKKNTKVEQESAAHAYPTPPPSQPTPPTSQSTRMRSPSVSSLSSELSSLSSDSEASDEIVVQAKSQPEADGMASPMSISFSASPLSSLPTAPPTPISPSKRYPSSSSIDRRQRSPMKKTKSFNIPSSFDQQQQGRSRSPMKKTKSFNIPSTGIPPSPGGGNLFALRPTNSMPLPIGISSTPTKGNIGATIDGDDDDMFDYPAHMSGLEATADDYDTDIFGLPTNMVSCQKDGVTGHKHASSAPIPMTRTRRTRSKTAMMGKENINLGLAR